MIPLFPPKNTINTFSTESIGAEIANIGQSLNDVIGAINPVTSTAYFIPCWVAEPVSITQFFVGNGGTIGGSIDVGLYDQDGFAIKTAGSTTQAGASTIQTFALSPNIPIGPGRYYMAVSVANTQSQLLRVTWTTTTLPAMAGMKLVFNTFPLPTTSVSFTNQTTTSTALGLLALPYVPLIGFSTNVVA
jgi:hypothetical protein